MHILCTGGTLDWKVLWSRGTVFNEPLRVDVANEALMISVIQDGKIEPLRCGGLCDICIPSHLKNGAFPVSMAPIELFGIASIVELLITFYPHAKYQTFLHLLAFIELAGEILL